MRLLLRLLSIGTMTTGEQALRDHEQFGSVYDLCYSSLAELETTDKPRYHTMVKMAQQAQQLLQHSARGRSARWSIDDIARLCSTMQYNCHELPDIAEHMTERKVQSNAAGVGLFPAACRFNHSCEPVCTFHACLDGGPMRLRVSTMFGAAQGRELTISYTSLHSPRRERQRSLLAIFGFTCACARCQTPEEEDDRATRAFVGPGSGLHLTIAQLPCDARADCIQREREVQSAIDARSRSLLRSALLPSACPASVAGTPAWQLAHTHWLAVGAHRLAASCCIDHAEWEHATDHVVCALRGRLDALGEAQAQALFATACDLHMLLRCARQRAFAADTIMQIATLITNTHARCSGVAIAPERQPPLRAILDSITASSALS
jgi:hypothetical protein